MSLTLPFRRRVGCDSAATINFSREEVALSTSSPLSHCLKFTSSEDVGLSAVMCT